MVDKGLPDGVNPVLFVALKSIPMEQAKKKKQTDVVGTGLFIPLRLYLHDHVLQQLFWITLPLLFTSFAMAMDGFVSSRNSLYDGLHSRLFHFPNFVL